MSITEQNELTAVEIDTHVGERIRNRRVLMGLTQEQLGDALNISYQQIQKYETGANRVSAGRLYMISRILEIPVSQLFDGLGQASVEPMSQGSRNVIELVRSFSKIRDDKTRSAVMSLVRALAEKDSSDSEERIDDASNNSPLSH